MKRRPKRKPDGFCDMPEMLGFGAPIHKLETNRPTYFIEQVPPGIMPEVYSKAVAEAFNVWSLAGDVRFTEVSKLEDAIIVVTMKAFPKKTLGSLQLGAAQYPNGEGRTQHCYLNSLRKWTVSASRYAGLADVRHTLRHEGGHLLGLVHPPDGPPPEIMDRFVNKNVFRPARTEAAIVAKLYGPPQARRGSRC